MKRINLSNPNCKKNLAIKASGFAAYFLLATPFLRLFRIDVYAFSTLLLFLLSLPGTCLAAPSTKNSKLPNFMSASYVDYDAGQDVIYASGNVKISKDNYLLTGDSLVYDIKNDLLWVEGNINLQDSGQLVVAGDRAFLKDKLKQGVISNFVINFGNNNLLAARLAKRIAENEAILTKCSFTSCFVPEDGKPIWQMSAKRTHIDLEKQRITYKNLFFEIYGVPVFFTPYFSHPTPKAKAHSGVLMPEVKKNDLRLPLYLRLKPNLDATLTPRLTRGNLLYELELRHKSAYGYHLTQGSYGSLPYTISNPIGGEIDKTIARYHLFTRADFTKEGYHYGFNIRRTSDKAYLKNYYEMFDNYLASEIYFNKISGYNYTSVKGLSFQGMKKEDPSSGPLVLPRVKTKNVVYLNDDNLYLTLTTNSLTYKELPAKEFGKTSITTSISNDALTNGGHVTNFSARNTIDAYLINSLPTGLDSNKWYTRTIPELEGSWRYPLISPFFKSYSVIIEPTVQAILGKNYSASNEKFGLIDANRYDLSENSLFSANRYSGTDYHEFGKRFNYGLQTVIKSNDNFFGIFTGQSLNRHNSPITRNKEIVGKVNFIRDNQFELFYRYRKTKAFLPIRDEIGLNVWKEKFTGELGAIQLSKLNRYYFLNGAVFSYNNIRQAYYKLQYYLNENWTIGNEVQFDMSGKKNSLIYNNISLSYYRDCIGFSIKVSQDYTSDISRGIVKNRKAYNFALKLKSINM